MAVDEIASPPVACCKYKNAYGRLAMTFYEFILNVEFSILNGVRKIDILQPNVPVGNPTNPINTITPGSDNHDVTTLRAANCS